MDFDGLTATGVKVHVDHFKDRLPEFDPRSGNHFWIITGAWGVDPEKWLNGESNILDYENLVSVVGPGCWFCERAYTISLSHRRCTGPQDGV